MYPSRLKKKKWKPKHGPDYEENAAFEKQDHVRNARRYNLNNRKLHFYDQSEYELCPCFVLYERVDLEDPLSPYYLKEYNLLHSHALNMSISFPMTFNTILKDIENVV